MKTTMTATNFSGMKKQGRNKCFEIWEWGRNKGFWPEYLPMLLTKNLGVSYYLAKNNFYIYIMNLGFKCFLCLNGNIFISKNLHSDIMDFQL